LRPSPSPRAVTLFELIVVVLVTALLAILFVLSTQFLIVRTKVSRVREEHRVLARALQNYQMDYNNLPSETNGLESLTAPTAYLARVPSDPFSGQEQHAYLYINPDGKNRVYILVSAGPDMQLSIAPFLAHARSASRVQSAADAAGTPAAGIDPAPMTMDDWFNAYRLHHTYDPTNGLVSAGDIITVITNY
jgi:type II secretory pathway pseudopilin PulG